MSTSQNPDGPTPDRTVKVPHLVMALLFGGIVALWALVASRSVGTDEVAFLAPGVLVAAGVLGLLASVLSGRNRRRRPTAYPPAAGRLVEEPRHQADTAGPADPLDDLLRDDRDDEPDPDDLEHTAPVTPVRDRDRPDGPTPNRQLTRQDRPEETR